ncbi:hypothetical protein KIN20_025975 [Parelaphostrongylus tenuis]|uniref:Uncharacterized protein n=1 Tax=Parelaphostrongylus tenuis TaxID=148309 RepID=A0AAD5NB44_PARTN|nr:hypothetical protein KIN20_025975 [Parelaphostrongylus tenuis]
MAPTSSTPIRQRSRVEILLQTTEQLTGCSSAYCATGGTVEHIRSTLSTSINIGVDLNCALNLGHISGCIVVSEHFWAIYEVRESLFLNQPSKPQFAPYPNAIV